MKKKTIKQAIDEINSKKTKESTEDRIKEFEEFKKELGERFDDNSFVWSIATILLLNGFSLKDIKKKINMLISEEDNL